MVPAAKEILFSTGILFITFFNSNWGFSKGMQYVFVRFADFVKFRHFQDWEMNLLYIPGFLGHLGTPIICKAERLFYRSSISLSFVCTSSKLLKASSTQI